MIGTDLSPIQPNWVPPNLEFQLDDANQEWTWPDNTFDYIHMRAMFGSIVDWRALYREAFRCCKPGGYFEDYENSIKIDSDDGSVSPGSPFDQWTKVFWEGGNKFGRTFRVVEDDIQKKYMEEAGFEDVTVWEFKVRIKHPSVSLQSSNSLISVPHRQLAVGPQVAGDWTICEASP